MTQDPNASRRTFAFIVKGPPTYMNAEEAWHAFKCTAETATLFIIIPKGNPHSRTERMQTVIDPKKWKKIVWIQSTSNVQTYNLKHFPRKSRITTAFLLSRRLFAYFIDRKRLDKIAGSFQPFSIVFSVHNDIHEHLAAALEPSKLILLDSGQTVLSRITKSGFIDYRQDVHFTERYALAKLGLKVFDRNRTTLFSTYADILNTKHQVLKNQMSYKRSLIDRRPNGKYAVWISAPFIDRYGVDAQAYVRYIKNTLLALELPERELVYVPHPGKESPRTLKFVSDQLGCKIDDRFLPVELKISYYDKIPSVCVSPYSSSLANLGTFAGGRVRVMSSWHREFNYFERLVAWRKRVENDPSLNIEFLDLATKDSLFFLGSSAQFIGKTFEYLGDWRALLDSAEEQPCLP